MKEALAPLAVGRHLVVGFAGRRPGDAGVEALRRRAEGDAILGAVLFSYNVESPAQLQELTAYIRSWQRPQNLGPLLVMVDQEGGRVQRLTAAKGFVPSPSAQDFGRMSPALQRASARASAEQLRAVGVDVNFGPVCDLAVSEASVIGRAERAYGREADGVAAAAGVWAGAHADCGVAVTLKHFPGLGGARGDTHAGLIDATADWQRAALVPFERLGPSEPLAGVMSTHMVQRTLEPSGLPLTFSRAVMTDLLRDEVGFDGPLLTDDLNMGAMAHHFCLDETLERAVLAGHDVLVVGENEAALGDGRPPAHVPVPDLVERVAAAVKRAIDGGALTAEAWALRGARIERWQRALDAARSRRAGCRQEAAAAPST